MHVEISVFATTPTNACSQFHQELDARDASVGKGGQQ